MEINKVCVIGAGLMGKQIALNTAQNGYAVTLTDSSEKALSAAREWAGKYLSERVEKGKMTDEKVSEIKARLHFEPDLKKAARDAQLIVEAIIEDKSIKEDLFRQLNEIISKDAIVATNSSYMVSSTFKDMIDNPSRLANLHFFNPALVMKLTEVVQGDHTSDETIELLLDFSRKTGKDPIWVRKEIDGFIVNRILRAVTNEALYLLENGIATAPEIDTAAEKGLNYPMGPFRLQDFTGIDLAFLAAKKTLEETGFKKPGYEILEEKYEKGEFGKKSGKGWYDYE
ncbi:3-hydroxybutyryl-CoA dehydrogenase [Clostridia bacterium]|nr:3-hydroxybutyryl-CoA dehydrogenase [Clostridia bacterium]